MPKPANSGATPDLPCAAVGLLGDGLLDKLVEIWAVGFEQSTETLWQAFTVTQLDQLTEQLTCMLFVMTSTTG